MARHENEIGGTTDVAQHPEFAARRTVKTIDGRQVAGWFTKDFTYRELRTLRAKERLPAVRPDNTAYDGQERIPTLDEVIRLARREGVGIYAETNAHAAGLVVHVWTLRRENQFMDTRFQVGTDPNGPR